MLTQNSRNVFEDLYLDFNIFKIKCKSKLNLMDKSLIIAPVPPCV